MREVQRFTIPTQYGRLAPLRWQGDQLIDFGWSVRYNLDGTTEEGHVGGFGGRFDSAISSSDGRYAVIYGELGTKGLILKDGKVVREINRSYYHSHIYEYPIAIFNWMDGRTVIAHCPEEYCRLEIEEIESGVRVVSRNTKSMDFFHSQLQTSPDGRYLLSAGWVWQPFNLAWVFDLHAAQKEPEILDKGWSGFSGREMSEVYSGAFIDSSRIVLSGEEYLDAGEIDVLCVIELTTDTVLPKVQLQEAPGIMMPLTNHIVSFFKHPKLIHIATGEIVFRWDGISSGFRGSCFVRADEPKVHLALDPARRRFAVGNAESITVIQLG